MNGTRVLNQTEQNDLNHFIYTKLRHEFGRQVQADWCQEFTDQVVTEASKLRNDSIEQSFNARNKRMEELVENNSKQSGAQ